MSDIYYPKLIMGLNLESLLFSTFHNIPIIDSNESPPLSFEHINKDNNLSFCNLQNKTIKQKECAENKIREIGIRKIGIL